MINYLNFIIHYEDKYFCRVYYLNYTIYLRDTGGSIIMAQVCGTN